MSQYLTQTIVNRTAFTKKGERQRFIRDGKFGLRIGSQTKAFVVQSPVEAESRWAATQSYW
jgi:hypothetical protein